MKSEASIGSTGLWASIAGNAVGRPTVNADDGSAVSAEVRATVKVEAWATVKVQAGATVNAGGRSAVKAGDRSPVIAEDRTTVKPGDCSAVNAEDRATAIAEERADVKVEAWVTAKAGGRATVSAEDPESLSVNNYSAANAKDRATANGKERATVNAGAWVTAKPEYRATASADDRPAVSAEARAAANAKESAYGNAEAWVTAKREDCATVSAEDRATVSAEDRAAANAEESAYGNVEAWVTAKVEDRSTVSAEDRVTASAEARSAVHAEARVTANAEERVTANAEAWVTTKGEDRATVSAEDRVTVSAEDPASLGADDRSTVNAEGSAAAKGEERATVNARAWVTAKPEDRATASADDRPAVSAEARATANAKESAYGNAEAWVTAKVGDRAALGAEDRAAVSAEARLAAHATGHLARSRALFRGLDDTRSERGEDARVLGSMDPERRPLDIAMKKVRELARLPGLPGLPNTHPNEMKQRIFDEALAINKDLDHFRMPVLTGVCADGVGVSVPTRGDTELLARSDFARMAEARSAVNAEDRVIANAEERATANAEARGTFFVDNHAAVSAEVRSAVHDTGHLARSRALFRGLDDTRRERGKDARALASIDPERRPLEIAMRKVRELARLPGLQKLQNTHPNEMKQRIFDEALAVNKELDHFRIPVLTGVCADGVGVSVPTRGDAELLARSDFARMAEARSAVNAEGRVIANAEERATANAEARGTFFGDNHAAVSAEARSAVHDTGHLARSRALFRGLDDTRSERRKYARALASMDPELRSLAIAIRKVKKLAGLPELQKLQNTHPNERKQRIFDEALAINKDLYSFRIPVLTDVCADSVGVPEPTRGETELLARSDFAKMGHQEMMREVGRLNRAKRMAVRAAHRRARQVPSAREVARMAHQEMLKKVGKLNRAKRIAVRAVHRCSRQVAIGLKKVNMELREAKGGQGTRTLGGPVPVEPIAEGLRAARQDAKARAKVEICRINRVKRAAACAIQRRRKRAAWERTTLRASKVILEQNEAHEAQARPSCRKAAEASQEEHRSTREHGHAGDLSERWHSREMTEASWGDGSVGVEIRADEGKGRRTTADEASTTREGALTNGRANVDGTEAGEEELQLDGVALWSCLGTGEVNGKKTAVVDATGAGELSAVETMREELREKAIVQAAGGLPVVEAMHEELRAKVIIEAAKRLGRDAVEVEGKAERARVRHAEKARRRAEKQQKLERRASRDARRLKKLQDPESRAQLNGEHLKPPVERLGEPARLDRDVVEGRGGMLAQQDAQDDVHAAAAAGQLAGVGKRSAATNAAVGFVPESSVRSGLGEVGMSAQRTAPRFQALARSQPGAADGDTRADNASRSAGTIFGGGRNQDLAMGSGGGRGGIEPEAAEADQQIDRFRTFPNGQRDSVGPTPPRLGALPQFYSR